MVFIIVVIGVLVALGVYSCRDDMSIPELLVIGIFWPIAFIWIIKIGINRLIRRM